MTGWGHQDEVDYVLKRGEDLIGIEVKSGASSQYPIGIRHFKRRYPKSRVVVIGGEKAPGDFEWLSLEEFFARNEL